MKKTRKAPANGGARDLPQQVVWTEQQLKVARKRAHEAKLSYKKARKALKQAKKAAKLALKKAEKAAKQPKKTKAKAALIRRKQVAPSPAPPQVPST